MLSFGQRYREELAIARAYLDQLTTDALQNEVLFNRICKQHGIINAHAAKRILDLAGAEMLDRVERHEKLATKKPMEEAKCEVGLPEQ